MVAATSFALASGCSGPLVTTERFPIEWVRTDSRHGHFEKGGIALDGWTCGEQYERAVAGVPAAEDLIESCSRSNTAYGVLMSAFAVLPITGFGIGLVTSDHATRDVVIGTGVGLGLAAFAVGLVMGYRANTTVREAVHVYNRAR